MNGVWNPAAVSSSDRYDALATRQKLASAVIMAAVLFNFMLCFVNTRLFAVSARLVISAEVVLIGIALGLIWDRSSRLYALLLLLAAYFAAVMVLRADFDAQIVRDLLIPIIFFFAGRYFGSFYSADRLVTLLIIMTLGTALFEWLALTTYLHYFDVIHYYIARGTVASADTEVPAGLYVSGTRFEPRTLLPFLGDHRASGLFLEPVSAGNFGAIAFAWVLLRDRQRGWVLVAKTLAIVTVLVLADDRFGFYLCLLTLLMYVASPIVRRTMLFLAPFLAMIAIAAYANAHWPEAWDNTMPGRILLAGNYLTALDPWQLFGLQTSGVDMSDSGYAYTSVKVGLIGMAAIWALFIYSPVLDRDAWRFKNFIAFYTVFLLCISTSLFTIKTAALLWFLYGTLNNPNRAVWGSPPAARLAA